MFIESTISESRNADCCVEPGKVLFLTINTKVGAPSPTYLRTKNRRKNIFGISMTLTKMMMMRCYQYHQMKLTSNEDADINCRCCFHI